MPKLKDRLMRKDESESTDEVLLDQIAGYPHLMALKPNEKMVFHSDYIEVDNDYVTTILDFFHSESSVDNLGSFWGTGLVPANLEENNVTTILFEQTRRQTDAWIERHQSQSDRLGRMSERDMSQGGTLKSKQTTDKKRTDREQIFYELQGGGAYLNVHFSMLVKAPNIETLDWAIASIGRQYISSNMSNIKVAAYDGEQKNAISRLFSLNKKKRNKGWFFTSQEYAGAYSLITNGFDDPEGEYIGKLLYDYNKSAVVFDVDNYFSRTVVAYPKRDRSLGNAYYTDVWMSKQSQAALQNNHKVVHIVLSESTNLDRLGPKFENFTRRVDMTRGEINMFEVFGDKEHEQSDYARNKEKLRLMTDQLFRASEDSRALALGAIKDVFDEFYIEQGMWVKNATDNRDEIRVIGVPHTDVPRLRLFRDYLVARYEASKTQGDKNMTNVYNLLRTTFDELLTAHGDLFDRHTTDLIDTVGDGRRVIYDFAGLNRRGKGVAMAQLINVISFAVSNLGEGDIVMFHGAENIVNAHDISKNNLLSNEVKQFIDDEIAALLRRGGRVVFGYEDVNKMLMDQEFNRFDSADYMVLGTMSSNTVNEYETKLGKRIPAPFKKLVTDESSDLCFIRRGSENVLFEPNISLGFRSDRTDMSAARMANRAIAPHSNGFSAGMQGSLTTSTQEGSAWSKGAARRAKKKDKVLPRQTKRKVARRTIGSTSSHNAQAKKDGE